MQFRNISFRKLIPFESVKKERLNAVGVILNIFTCMIIPEILFRKLSFQLCFIFNWLFTYLQWITFNGVDHLQIPRVKQLRKVLKLRLIRCIYNNCCLGIVSDEINHWIIVWESKLRPNIKTGNLWIEFTVMNHFYSLVSK